MKEFLGRLGLIIISVCITLFALEIGWRIGHKIPVFSDDNFVINALDLIKNDSNCRYHPQLGWCLPENSSRKLGDGTILTTGQFGIRMNSSEIKPPQQNAILVVGDSFAAGSETSDHESWPAYLEQMLQQPVINAAVGGYGVDQMFLRAEILVKELKPHTLIVGILTEDVLRNAYEIFGGGFKPYYDIENNSLVLRNVPVPKLKHWNNELGIMRSLLGRSYLVHWLMRRSGNMEWWVNRKNKMKKAHDDQTGQEIGILLMNQFKKLGEENNIRVIVVLQYGAGQILSKEAPWYGPPVLTAAKKSGLETLDTRNPLKIIADRNTEEFQTYWSMHEHNTVYGHMSSKGNALIAQLIKEKFFSSHKK